MTTTSGACALRARRSARTSRSPSTRTSAGTSPSHRLGEPLAEFDIAWIEEPTSPDDILGHAAIARGVHPIPVATGEHCQNRVVFKQLLQADAIDVLQIDAARVAGVNENIAILLLAAKFGVRVCPHAGGVGLCEAVQHLSMFDFIAVSGTRRVASSNSSTTCTSTSSPRSTSAPAPTGRRTRPGRAAK